MQSKTSHKIASGSSLFVLGCFRPTYECRYTGTFFERKTITAKYTSPVTSNIKWKNWNGQQYEKEDDEKFGDFDEDKNVKCEAWPIFGEKRDMCDHGNHSKCDASNKIDNL